jgi:16S rRNA C967 or C1407 C5-methylase (RsmB/RsmF family)
MVLDLAAAPGGKTSLLAAMMQNTGSIRAVEPVRDRFFRLKANCTRLGVHNTRYYQKDGRAVGRLKENFFDRVLLDAPCSSESRFVWNQPESFQHWKVRKVYECARKQKQLLQSAFDALKAGGRLLYSTCSFAPEENECVVDELLRKNKNAVIVPIQIEYENMREGLTQFQNMKLDERCRHTRRVIPNQRMNGFYMALFEKE